jgi:hypothetical protein
MFKIIRISILLIILLGVVIGYLNEAKLRDWNQPLWVTIYPINGDQSTRAQHYINNLRDTDFSEIENFVAAEAKYWKLPLQTPVQINIASEIHQLPPIPKESNVINNIIFTLQLRLWTWRHANTDFPEDIKILVNYFDPSSNTKLLHSLGIERGKIGLVNAFAAKTYQGLNAFVIAHELLHTMGATDKYDTITNQPVFPDGYANPYQEPLYPQIYAEIMGGGIAQSESRSDIPDTLGRVVVREKTAIEIGWKN